MKQIRIFSRGLRNWIRGSHCYFGLFISPFILLFAITGIMFNHRWKMNNTTADVKIEKETASVEVPTDLKGLEQAKQVLGQLGISGEILSTRHMPKQNRMAIAVTKPGQFTTINIDLKEQKAEIQQRQRGIWSALFYLHKSPGPHNIQNRANWFFTKLWVFLVDASVYLLIGISISGVYLWYVIKSERKIGLILLGAGCLSFFLALFAIVG